MEVTLDIARPETRTYSVRGATLEAVVRNLGRRCWGRYVGRFSYDIRPRGGIVASAVFRAAPTITLPRWHDRAGATAPQQREWDRMLRALERHEDEHHAVLVDAFENMRHFLSTQPDPAVPQFRRDMAAFDADLDRFQRDFDATSEHGRRAGVVLDTTV